MVFEQTPDCEIKFGDILNLQPQPVGPITSPSSTADYLSNTCAVVAAALPPSDEIALIKQQNNLFGSAGFAEDFSMIGSGSFGAGSGCVPGESGVGIESGGGGGATHFLTSAGGDQTEMVGYGQAAQRKYFIV